MTPQEHWRRGSIARGYRVTANGPHRGVQLSQPVEADPAAAITRYTQIFGNPALTWEDLEFVRDAWSGPIVLKGILSVDDARRAADAGMDGLGLGGADGVRHVLRSLRAGFELTMRQCGDASLGEVSRDLLTRA